jgi:5'-nucleotidase
VKQLHPDVDLVVSGHTHSVLSALLPNSAGTPTLVTQAFHASTGFADIELTIDSATGDVVAKQARIVSPWADVPPAKAIDPEIVALISKAESSVKNRTEKVIGVAESTIHAPPDAAGNSELGDLIVDAQREAVGADLAFTTPSWVRGDLQSGTVAWGELFRVQPFGNRLMKMDLTGQQIIDLLNQQWTPEDHPRILHVSGISYRWDASRAPKERVVEVLRDGKPIALGKHYTVALNEYLAEGGDAFTLLQNVPRRPAGLLDVDALERYVKKHSPLRARAEKRIVRVK